MNAPSNGIAAVEIDNLIADLRRRLQQLLAEKDQQQQECNELRQQIAILTEKCANYAAVVRHWGRAALTPEDAERIMRHDQWVGFEDIERVLAEVQDATHG